MQGESCELSIISGKMRTASWETAPQIALRGCSKEAGGGGLIYKILVKDEFNALKLLFYKRFFTIHEELMSP